MTPPTTDQEERAIIVSAQLEGELMRRYVQQADSHAGQNKSAFLRHVISEGLTRMEDSKDIEDVIRETIRDELADDDSDTDTDHKTDD